MHRARLFRMLLPRELDGAELDPPSFVRVIEAVAKLDASTAWSLCQTSVCAMTAAFLDPEAARTVWSPPDAVLAWGPLPGGTAVAVEGGYRVTGTWSFASGAWQGTWFSGTRCRIHEADGSLRLAPDGKPVVRSMLFPAARATMRLTWDVIGLRGTGSDTYSVQDLFVPQDFSVFRQPSERR